MFSMLSEDTEEKLYDTKEILNSLKNNEPYNMFKIF